MIRIFHSRLGHLSVAESNRPTRKKYNGGGISSYEGEGYEELR